MLLVLFLDEREPGAWFNIKYRKSHREDKTVVRSSYLHSAISYSGKMTSLYRISPVVTHRAGERYWFSLTHVMANSLVGSRPIPEPMLPRDQRERDPRNRGEWSYNKNAKKLRWKIIVVSFQSSVNYMESKELSVVMQITYIWPALRAGLLCCNFFGQPGSVSKFPPFLWVKLWVGWVGRGYTEISRYFPASWINWVTLVTKIKLLYSLRF